MFSDAWWKLVLDPAAGPMPEAWLWPMLLGGAGVTAAGLAVILWLLRRMGPPVGALPREFGPLAVGIAFAVMILPALVRGSMLLNGAVAVLIAVMAIVALAMLQARDPAGPGPQWLRFRMRDAGLCLIVSAVLVPTISACMIASVCTVQLCGGEVAPQPQIGRLHEDSGPVWMLGWYVSAGLGAPLIEEFAFRLALYGGLAGWLAVGPRAAVGRWIALVLSGTLFVAAHGWWPIGFAPLALLALVFTLAFAHSRSLWPCVMLHGVHNMLALTLQFFVIQR